MLMRPGCVAWTMVSTPVLFPRPFRHGCRGTKKLTRKHRFREEEDVKIALDMGQRRPNKSPRRGRGRTNRPCRRESRQHQRVASAVSAVVERRGGASLLHTQSAADSANTKPCRLGVARPSSGGILPCPWSTPRRLCPGMRWACGSAAEGVWLSKIPLTQASVSLPVVPCMCLVGIKTQTPYPSPASVWVGQATRRPSPPFREHEIGRSLDNGRHHHTTAAVCCASSHCEG